MSNIQFYTGGLVPASRAHRQLARLLANTTRLCQAGRLREDDGAKLRELRTVDI